MTVICAPTFVEMLRRCKLLETNQLEQLIGSSHPPDDARSLARQLIERNWLTPYQVNQLLQGRGAELFLGPYLVLERLGEGGTGQVFKARHQRMKRLVALKLIRRELLTDPEVVQRFLREIQVVSQLSHPNVVHAYDAGPLGPTYFLAMEYVEGIDLAALVKRSGPLPVAQACDFLRQAALGLQHAHERGLVHRDVKPPNFLVTPRNESGDGLIKLLDLGLARLQRPVDGERTSMLTSTGPVMMGTPDYLAPEQALDFHGVDVRADIYSLGCTGYYLLTGQPPFPGGTLAQKLLRHQQGECLPVENVRPDVPSELAVLLRRMLAKAPEDRPQTPREAADAFAVLLNGGHLSTEVPALDNEDHTISTSLSAARTLSPRPPSTVKATPEGADSLGDLLDEAVPRRIRGKSRRAWAGLFVAVALCLGLLTVLLLLPGAEGPDRTQGAAKPPPPPPPRLEWPEVLAAWKDGRTDREQLRPELLRCLQTQPGTPQAAQAAFLMRQLRSPLDRLEEKSIPADRRQSWHPKELVAVLGEAGTGEIPCVAFSPDGVWLASGAAEGKVRLWRMPLFDKPLVLQGHHGHVAGLRFSPDGQTLVAFANVEPSPTLWDLSGPTPRERAQLVGHQKAVRGVAFAPDARTLATASLDSTVRLWDLTRKGCPERAQFRGHLDRVLAVAFHPEGKTAVSSSLDQSIRFWEVNRGEGGDKPALLGYVGDHQRLFYTPDGKTLLSCGAQIAQGEGAFRAWDLTGEAPRLLWSIKNRNVPTIAVSPDGQFVAITYGNGEVSVYEALTGHRRHEWHWPHAVPSLDFAPDGRHLALPNSNGTIAILRLGIPLAGKK